METAATRDSPAARQVSQKKKAEFAELIQLCRKATQQTQQTQLFLPFFFGRLDASPGLQTGLFIIVQRGCACSICYWNTCFNYHYFDYLFIIIIRSPWSQGMALLAAVPLNNFAICLSKFTWKMSKTGTMSKKNRFTKNSSVAHHAKNALATTSWSMNCVIAADID